MRGRGRMVRPINCGYAWKAEGSITLAISYAVVAGLFGLIFGSAINAMVWRWYVGRSWVTGLVFALSAYVLMPVTAVKWVQFGFWLVLLLMLIVLAVYDLRWMLLPDKVMVPLIVVALVYTVTI